MPEKNDRLIRALRRQPVDRVPMWVMRQAGRYLPEYRKIRERVDFKTLCKNPELCCEVALQPLARFDLDAAIVFSDILTIPDAMGLGLEFAPDHGPYFERPVRDRRAIQALGVPDMQTDLGYVSEAVRVLVQALAGRLPVIGFSGSPWTLATYMVEGGSSRHFKRIKSLMFDEPKTLQHLLDCLTQTIQLYLKAQIEAGAEAVMIFDSWGGVLDAAHYRRFSLEPMRAIVHALKAQAETAEVPIILFTKGGGTWLDAMASTDCDALSLDWTIDLAQAKQRLGHRVALQGNLDPMALYAKPEVIDTMVKQLFEAMPDRQGYVFNLGHGILPEVPPDHVGALVQAVKRYGGML